MGSPSDSLDVLRQFGTEALSFQALATGTRWWQDDPAPTGTGAVQPFVVSGRSWIAIGGPLVGTAHRAEAARRFAADARAAGQRAVWFGVEDLSAFQGLTHLAIGQQPILIPSRWPATLAKSPKLREQIRRARAKHVEVKRLSSADVAAGSPVRAEIERLRDAWLSSRRMEPLGFLVAIEPFHQPDEHVYLLATQDGRAVQFLSAVPIYARAGWMIQDVFRSRDAPNGTAAIVIDRLMREVGDRAWLTHGLTPLSGELPGWLRASRGLMAPLYDFSGLFRFRARLSPARWEPVWLVWDRGWAGSVLFDVLRSFANGTIVRFALRSLTRHPNGPPWAVAVPLVPWIALLVLLAEMGRGQLLGYSNWVLRGWIAFDVVMAWALFRAARRPKRRALAVLALAAGVDAIMSIRHLALVGWGHDAISVALRSLATLGPIIGAAALVRAANLVKPDARR